MVQCLRASPADLHHFWQRGHLVGVLGRPPLEPPEGFLRRADVKEAQIVLTWASVSRRAQCGQVGRLMRPPMSCETERMNGHHAAPRSGHADERLRSLWLQRGTKRGL